MPIARDAKTADGATSYVYEFAQPAATPGFGACHALEIAFVFDDLDAEGNEKLGGPMRADTLASAMHAAWVAFATCGNPGWQAYDETRPTMVFAESDGGVADDPRGAERAVWTA